MIPIIVILGIIIIALISVIYFLIQKNNKLSEDKDKVQLYVSDIQSKLAASEAKLENISSYYENIFAEREKNYERNLQDLEKHYEERLSEARFSIENRFKTLATDTLDVTVQKHAQIAQQTIDAALNPMREAFKKLSEEIERRNLDNCAERTVLQEGIKTLQQLNLQIGDETKRLTNALRGNTGFQGRWGEMVLENILEASGLEKSRWVVYQASTTTEEGSRLRPDAVIHCPRNREIIIDVKVSLKDYLNMTESENSEERATFMNAHVRSIENHLKNLSAKEYQNNIGSKSAGFVLMFVPHEGAYLTAMQAKADLWQKAYERRVVIVSPTHLVTVIRLVEQMWQTEDQTANSIAIAEEATKMMDQLNDFLEDLLESEKNIKKTEEKIQGAIKRLSTGNGNVIRRAERLKILGIKTKKDLRLKSDEVM